MSEYYHTVYTDPKTEIQFGIKVDNLTEQKQIKENQIHGLKHKISKYDLEQWIQNEQNYFYFLVYRKLIEDFPDTPALLFRFMYLCTFGDYSNQGKQGKLLYGNAPMTVENMKSVLRLSNKPTNETIKGLTDRGLIKITEEGIIPNSDYYLRGKVKIIPGSVTRVFNKGLQELYEKSNYREHKMLAHFIPLLPYVNYYNNVICSNPEEKDIKKIHPFTLKDIAELFGVDKSNSNRLKRKLLDITVHDYYLMGYFTRDFGNGLLKCFIVNPYVFFKAGALHDLDKIAKLFDIPNNIN